jgi:F0F1-type ATP synthase gamma subunit
LDFKEKQRVKESYSVLAVGRKAKEYFERKKITLAKTYIGFGDYSKFTDTRVLQILLFQDL